MIKKFENFNSISVEQVKDFFIDFMDDVLEVKYPIEFDFELKDNTVWIKIKYDFYYKHWLEKDVDEIIKRLKTQYMVKKWKPIKTGQYNRKELPVHGRDYTTFVSDPIYLLKISVK
jgi:hypothetical protein